MIKKRSSIILLFIFALISWGIWVIEVKPFTNTSWDFINEKKITFILAPLLFILWGYLSKIVIKIRYIIFDLLIFLLFFLIILFLIISAHVAGPSAMIFLLSPFRFLLYKPISLFIVSLFVFGFNIIIAKLNGIEIIKKDMLIIYMSFFIIPVIMFFISFLFKLFNANEYITGFFGFNNMDTILWFKSGIIIPISFIYEGLLFLFIKKDNYIK